MPNSGDIEALNGATANACQVPQVITRNADAPEELPLKKIVQNKLKLLRDECLIP